MMKNLFLALAVGLLLNGTAALATAYNYIEPTQMKENLQTKAPMTVIDIQVAEEFAKHHLPGAVSTCAYPVKSDVDRAKLAGALQHARSEEGPVVIVCPRGGGGAKRTYDYLKEQGIAEARLLILKKGQLGWPFVELTETVSK